MRHAADALSLARALLALPLVWALAADAPSTALVVLALAVASDVLDGRLARRAVMAEGGDRSAAEPLDATRAARQRRGASLDVGADAVFLLAGLTTSWTLGQMPVWLPLVAVAMLARFFLSSPGAAGLRYDPVGRHYGTMLHVVLAVWLLGAPEVARQVTLAAVSVVTAVALAGRTRFLRTASS